MLDDVRIPHKRGAARRTEIEAATFPRGVVDRRDRRVEKRIARRHWWRRRDRRVVEPRRVVDPRPVVEPRIVSRRRRHARGVVERIIDWWRVCPGAIDWRGPA